MRIIDYTSKLPPMVGANIHYRNPKFWNGEAESCDWVNTTNPKIIAIYKQAGIPVWEGMPEKPVTPPTILPETNTAIPDDWMKLPLAKKKSLASNYTDEKVTHRIKAEEILEAAYRKQQGEL